MKIDPNFTCSNCDYFQRLPGRDTQKDEVNSGLGNCLYLPPTGVIIGKKRGVAQFPLVLGKFRCSMHSGYENTDSTT